MRAFLVLCRLRILDVLRSASASALFFGLPLVVLLILALVFAGGHPFERRVALLVESGPELAPARATLGRFSELLLESEPSLEVALERLQARAASVVVSGERGELVLRVGENEQLFGRGLQAALGPGTRLLPVATPASGYLRFVFPGLLASAVMFAGLFSMGHAMARYRQNLFLKKLATTPLSRSSFVAAQIAGRAVLVLVQLLLLLGGALWLLELEMTVGRALSTLAVAVLGLLVFSGLGFALATTIRNEAVVSDVISVLGLPIALLSGIFYPLGGLPEALRDFCALLPSTLLVDATRGTLLYGSSLGHELGTLSSLMAWGLAAFVLSIALFRWHE